MEDQIFEANGSEEYREEKEDDVVLTQHGYKKLQEELEHVKNVKRWEVAKRLEQARAFGDITENSEYEDAKQEQAFVQGRILEIERILDNARVIREDEINLNQVTIGSLVHIEDMERRERFSLRVVSAAEARGDQKCISDQSPVGKAIIGHKAGDTVKVQVPSGMIKYRVLEIER
ncbi:MAG: transcription elongation factor GreA [Candidatus Solincola sediminis]|uniref:Transcription elongation factor GreA n=1 Tax=Candidatus Solincola sediminis TaxID=1797199 RepID=A0A1F2WF49_9ACTN|nr:MAG: transcription elongation factor GreA [Candidatus Solincola sediminis]OFW57834.1 MAG: transcription elongation factor GreA [Candidatus Solincola sediminis]